MLKSIGIFVLSLILYTAFALTQYQTQTILTAKAEAWNKVCPIEGKVINREIKVITYKSRRYGFCSEACAIQFKENPEAYTKNLSDDGTKFLGNSGNQSLKENQ